MYPAVNLVLHSNSIFAKFLFHKVLSFILYKYKQGHSHHQEIYNLEKR